MKHKRRTFLGMAGGTAVAAAITGTAVYSATGLFQASAQANQTLDGGSEPLDGVSSPQFTKLTPFKDPLRIPPTLRPGNEALTKVDLVEAQIRLHSQMPATRLWTYMGHFPGPTIEVRRGQRTRIAWKNNLKGTIPVKAVFVAPDGPGPGLLPYNSPGSKGATTRPEVDMLTAWTTVHLHGGHNHALHDGGADLAVTPGSAQLAEYGNDQAATHLFYHDHAMAITALNVQAGLMGHYVIRDEVEDQLALPGGGYEIPLAIQDVNFDTDDQGRLTGQILSKKITPAKPEPGMIPPSLATLSPFTMVNGVVWPYLDVEARAYRFRLVNLSPTRIYRMAVVDEETGKVVRGAMKVLATDLGLLGAPQTIDEALSLSPAERADIVIDFAAFRGKKLKLVNTIPGQTPGAALPDFIIPFPEVMQFRVGARRNETYTVPAKLSPGFKRLTRSDVPEGAVERFVVLTLDKAGMPVIWEMKEVSGEASGEGVVQIALPGGTKTLRRVASIFEDATTFFAASSTWEKWNLINIAPPNVPIYHPLHIHLMDFQVVDRRAIDVSGMDFAAASTTAPITVGDAVPVAPEESGWKDTITVNANTMVTIGGKIAEQTGRVMYHCHLFDHEDEGMMRPLVVMPPAVHYIHGGLMGMSRGDHHAM
ncbi:multicopper oxidase domain-containing protein [Streptomyces sp. NPDC046900]|uniref:multicopper oxidase family protein n=1 Tax=Streptomyces sp. NPDC046900 TaxID=3155473 RepID=UPI0033FC434A